jgi:hypothetical protein
MKIGQGKATMPGGYKFVKQIKNIMVQFLGEFGIEI